MQQKELEFLLSEYEHGLKSNSISIISSEQIIKFCLLEEIWLQVQLSDRGFQVYFANTTLNST